jgi:hypothetical protein
VLQGDAQFYCIQLGGLRGQNSDRTADRYGIFLKSLQSLLVFYCTGDNYRDVQTGYGA